jgi:hypothetical protein
MKIKCENVVRCGNRNCVHNTDGYYCKNTVISLDASGVCAFRNSKPVKPKTNPNPNPDPFVGSNAC